jgi:hypothetical protein
MVYDLVLWFRIKVYCLGFRVHGLGYGVKCLGSWFRIIG